MSTKFIPGDRVAYSAKFLRQIGLCGHGSAQDRGTAKAVRPLAHSKKCGPVRCLATLRWFPGGPSLAPGITTALVGPVSSQASRKRERMGLPRGRIVRTVFPLSRTALSAPVAPACSGWLALGVR